MAYQKLAGANDYQHQPGKTITYNFSDVKITGVEIITDLSYELDVDQ